MKMSLIIVGGAGLAGALPLANQHPQFNYDQTAAQVGLGRASCQTSARGPQANPFLKWAMAEVYKQRGDKTGEDATRKLFRNAWAGPADTLVLAKL